MNTEPYLRLYRKVPNSDGNPNRYRIARLDELIIKNADSGEIVDTQKSWYLCVENEEDLGAVFIGTLDTVLEKYDIVEDKFGITEAYKMK